MISLFVWLARKQLIASSSVNDLMMDSSHIAVDQSFFALVLSLSSPGPGRPAYVAPQDIDSEPDSEFILLIFILTVRVPSGSAASVAALSIKLQSEVL